MIYDLVIIGGGPAGMSAALYAVRQNLKFLFIANELGGMANNIISIKTYIGHGYLSGYELIRRFKKHLEEYKVKVTNETVLKIRKNKKNFLIITNKNQINTKCILVATGRKFKKINIPGENTFAGKGVSECTACDGPLFKNKTIAVLGGGRTGLIGSVFLLNIAKKIYLIEKNNEIKTDGRFKPFADIIKKSKKVEILTNTQPIEIKGSDFVEEIIIKNKNKQKSLKVDGIFIEIGYNPNTKFVKDLVKTNNRGEIIVDADCKTNVPGIFAAGDVTHIREKQVIVAAGDGAKATLSCVLYLEKNK